MSNAFNHSVPDPKLQSWSNFVRIILFYLQNIFCILPIIGWNNLSAIWFFVDILRRTHSSRLSNFTKKVHVFQQIWQHKRNSDHYPNSPNFSNQIMNSTILSRLSWQKTDEYCMSVLGLPIVLISMPLSSLLSDQYLNSPNFSKCR